MSLIEEQFSKPYTEQRSYSRVYLIERLSNRTSLSKVGQTGQCSFFRNLSNRTILPKVGLTGQFCSFFGISLTGQFYQKSVKPDNFVFFSESL